MKEHSHIDRIAAVITRITDTLVKTFFLTILLVSATNTFAQDPHFSLFQGCPLFQNPANAGSESKLRLIVNQRNQWNNNSNGFRTSSLSFDTRLVQKDKRNLALGAFAFHDVSGGGSSYLSSFNIGIAYRIRISGEQQLSAGMGLGYSQHRLDAAAYRWSEQYDGSGYDGNLATGENELKLSSGFFDAGLGILWQHGDGSIHNNEKPIYAEAGISVFHPHRPIEEFITQSNVERRFVGHGLFRYYLFNHRYYLGGSIQQTVQGKQSEMIVGLNFAYIMSDNQNSQGRNTTSFISIGMNHRLRDAIIPQITMGYKNLRVYFSYDMSTGTYQEIGMVRNAFEIGLGFIL